MVLLFSRRLGGPKDGAKSSEDLPLKANTLPGVGGQVQVRSTWKAAGPVDRDE